MTHNQHDITNAIRVLLEQDKYDIDIDMKLRHLASDSAIEFSRDSDGACFDATWWESGNLRSKSGKQNTDYDSIAKSLDFLKKTDKEETDEP